MVPSSLNTGRRYEEDSVKRMEENGENNLPRSVNREEVASTSAMTKTCICSRYPMLDLMRDSSNPARTMYSDFWICHFSNTLETDDILFLACCNADSAAIQHVVTPSKCWGGTDKRQLTKYGLQECSDLSLLTRPVHLLTLKLNQE